VTEENDWQSSSRGDACPCGTHEIVFLESVEREKARLMGSLSASLAHELNNPLCGVNAFLERMSRNASLNEHDSYLLRLALEQCGRMKAVLKDIQWFMGENSQKNETFDLLETLSFVLRLMQKQLKLLGLQVHPPQVQDSVHVYGNEQQVKQMLLHLFLTIGQALVEAEGEITLQCVPRFNNVRLVIQCQVVPHRQEQLAELFSQLFSTQLPFDSDIAIVHSIVELHGASMQAIAPVQGIGALVITLPTEQTH